MDHRHRDAGKQPERAESLFTVREAVVFVRESPTLEDASSVDEIEPVVFDVTGTLAF